MKNGPLFYITSNICLNVFGGWRRWKIYWIYHAIIKLKEQGLSNRGVARILGIDKKTVNKYWNEYKSNLQKLEITDAPTEILKIQENIISKPKYNSESRVRRKITPECLKALENILEDEDRKTKILGQISKPWLNNKFISC